MNIVVKSDEYFKNDQLHCIINRTLPNAFNRQYRISGLEVPYTIHF